MSRTQPTEFDLATFASTFVPTFLEALFSGIYAVVFGLATYALGQGRPSVAQRGGKNLLVGANHLIFLLVLAHLALSLARCFSVKARSYRIEDFAWFFSDEWEGEPNTTSLDTARMAIYVTLVIIGNGFTLYRVHSTWHHWPVMIVPVLSILADIICGYMGFWATFMFVIFSWTAWFTFTLSSALILGHLLKNGPKPSRLRLIYEIATLATYSAVLFVGAITFLLTDPEVYAGFFILTPPIIGTVTLLASVQLGLHSAASSSRDALVFPGSAREAQQEKA